MCHVLCIRRWCYPLSCAALQLAVVAAALLLPRVALADAPPNVLFIAVDNMNDWVGCLGGYGGTIHMPHIDRLAARGTLFTNAHCDAPVCHASRSAILTGRRPSATGIYENQEEWPPIMPGIVTLPAHLKAHGYHVVGGGKVYHHTRGGKTNPTSQWHEYFEQVFDDPHQRVTERFWPPVFRSTASKPSARAKLAINRANKFPIIPAISIGGRSTVQTWKWAMAR